MGSLNSNISRCYSLATCGRTEQHGRGDERPRFPLRFRGIRFRILPPLFFHSNGLGMLIISHLFQFCKGFKMKTWWKFVQTFGLLEGARDEKRPPFRGGITFRLTSVGRDRRWTCFFLSRNNRPTAKELPATTVPPLDYLLSPDTTRGTNFMQWLVTPDLIFWKRFKGKLRLQNSNIRFEIVLCRNVYKGSNPFLCAIKGRRIGYKKLCRFCVFYCFLSMFLQF